MGTGFLISLCPLLHTHTWPLPNHTWLYFLRSMALKSLILKTLCFFFPFSVFSCSRQCCFQHLPRQRAASCEIQLPSLLGLNARHQSGSTGYISASETDLAGLFSCCCCRQLTVLEPACYCSTGISQTECGSAYWGL